MALGGAIMAPPRLAAHPTDSLLRTDLHGLLRTDPWLSGPNAAGLPRLAVSHMAEARATVSYQNGGFTNYHEAPEAIVSTASVEALRWLNQRVVLHGSIRYGNLVGRGMASSVFIDPSRMPFDIVEDSLSNTGRKSRDTYQLVGAVGGRLWRGLALGLKADFTAANYAKYKDLRHKNSFMDMRIAAGAYIPIGWFLQVGSSFSYRRNTESLRLAMYGRADKLYNSLICFGAFMGKIEQFGENGYTDKNRENPFLSEHWGLGLQLGVNFGPKLVWHNDLGYAKREGYFGKKSSFTISYNQHNGCWWAYRGRLSWLQAYNRHDLNAAIEVESLENLGNSYRSVVDPTTSAVYYEYFSPIRLASKKWTQMEFAYEGSWGIVGWLPTWSLRLGTALMRRRQVVFLYPYYRWQLLKSSRLFGEVGRNIDLGGALLTPRAALSVLWGSKTPYVDGTLAPPSAKQPPPPTMETYLWREFIYLTAPQCSMELSLRYSFVLKRAGIKPYAELRYALRRTSAVSTHLEGREHHAVGLGVGCTF